jgi:hypothetical protein
VTGSLFRSITPVSSIDAKQGGSYRTLGLAAGGSNSTRVPKPHTAHACEPLYSRLRLPRACTGLMLSKRTAVEANRNASAVRGSACGATGRSRVGDGLRRKHGGMLTREGGPMNVLIAKIQRGQSLGGTDEVQRNIISKRASGRPREPRTDNDRPFPDVPKILWCERGEGWRPTHRPPHTRRIWK